MLSQFKAQKRAAFIPFVVAGDPSLDVTEEMIDILVEEGADLLEIGVPFSDALADGPTIQAASERASTTTSLKQVLAFVKKVHGKHPKLPLILFTYFNPILKMGLDAFADAASSAGVSAVLVVDLPPEEAKEYLAKLEKRSLKTVFLASPTTSTERLAIVAQASTGFLYYVSRTGVTGVQTELSTSLGGEVRKLRATTDRSIAIGFGISTGPQAAIVAKLGDAVVVGSAFVKLIADAKTSDARKSEVRRLARELSEAIHK